MKTSTTLDKPYEPWNPFVDVSFGNPQPVPAGRRRRTVDDSQGRSPYGLDLVVRRCGISDFWVVQSWAPNRPPSGR